MSFKDHLRELVHQSLLDLKRAGTIELDGEPSFAIERSKNPEHGDYATNVAMLLAKPLRKNPRELAQAIATSLPKSQHIENVEIAGPGFINFRLNQACRQSAVRRVLELGERFGWQPEDSRESITICLVSGLTKSRSTRCPSDNS